MRAPAGRLLHPTWPVRWRAVRHRDGPPANRWRETIPGSIHPARHPVTELVVSPFPSRFPRLRVRLVPKYHVCFTALLSRNGQAAGNPRRDIRHHLFIADARISRPFLHVLAALRIMRRGLDVQATQHHHEEQRHEEMARKVAASMPPITPVPTAFCAPERHRWRWQRQHAEHEGQRSHDDGPQALPRRLCHGVYQRCAVS